MIDIHLLGLFILAVIALMLFPGPNVALIVANSVTRGPRYGLLTMAGTSSAMVIQLAVTAAGMGALLGTAGAWFALLRWFGVAYLLFLGVSYWRLPATDLTTAPSPNSGAKILRRGLIVSMTNPKTLFFYAAFFPQFITPNHHAAPQVAILAATFIAIAVTVDSGWVFAAHRARRLLSGRQTWTNRISGTALIGAGLGLAVARSR